MFHRSYSIQRNMLFHMSFKDLQINHVTYKQGQSPAPSIREYFYFIDHQGMLFLDDARMKNFTSCFKDKAFLTFFFRRLKLNTSGRYMTEFPYLSICGRERNFVRCDDYPVVFTHVFTTTVNGLTEDRLSYGYAGDLLSARFEPEKVFMLPETGRVYHPAPEITGSVGLVRSKLAIEFSKYFQFDEGAHKSPTHFIWNGTSYKLEGEWYYEAKKNMQMKCK